MYEKPHCWGVVSPQSLPLAGWGASIPGSVPLLWLLSAWEPLPVPCARPSPAFLPEWRLVTPPRQPAWGWPLLSECPAREESSSLQRLGNQHTEGLSDLFKETKWGTSNRRGLGTVKITWLKVETPECELCLSSFPAHWRQARDVTFLNHFALTNWEGAYRLCEVVWRSEKGYKSLTCTKFYCRFPGLYFITRPLSAGLISSVLYQSPVTPNSGPSIRWEPQKYIFKEKSCFPKEQHLHKWMFF